MRQGAGGAQHDAIIGIGVGVRLRPSRVGQSRFSHRLKALAFSCVLLAILSGLLAGDRGLLVAASAQSTTPSAIVLIHGLGSDAKTFRNAGRGRGVLQIIERRYPDVPVYFFDWDSQNRIEESGRQLHEWLSTHVAAGTSTHIIAHSMGGLVVRAFLDLPEAKSRAVTTQVTIASVTTLGTPHSGLGDFKSFVETQCRNLNNKHRNWIPSLIDVFKHQKAACDVWNIALQSAGVPVDTKAYEQLYGQLDPLLQKLESATETNLPPLLCIASRGDLIVPVKSALMQGSRAVTRWRPATHEVVGSAAAPLWKNDHERLHTATEDLGLEDVIGEFMEKHGLPPNAAPAVPNPGSWGLADLLFPESDDPRVLVRRNGWDTADSIRRFAGDRPVNPPTLVKGTVVGAPTGRVEVNGALYHIVPTSLPPFNEYAASAAAASGRSFGIVVVDSQDGVVRDPELVFKVLFLHRASKRLSAYAAPAVIRDIESNAHALWQVVWRHALVLGTDVVADVALDQAIARLLGGASASGAQMALDPVKLKVLSGVLASRLGTRCVRGLLDDCKRLQDLARTSGDYRSVALAYMSLMRHLAELDRRSGLPKLLDHTLPSDFKSIPAKAPFWKRFAYSLRVFGKRALNKLPIDRVVAAVKWVTDSDRRHYWRQVVAGDIALRDMMMKRGLSGDRRQRETLLKAAFEEREIWQRFIEATHGATGPIHVGALFAEANYVAHAPVEMTKADGPLGVIFVLDRSGSMSEEIRDVMQATVRSFGALRPQDLAAVLTFAENARVDVDVKRASKLHNDPAIISRLLSVSSGGGTVFSAALETAGHQLSRLPIGVRPVVVFMSDGEGDDPSLQVGKLRSRNIPIYTINFDSGGVADSRGYLHSMATRTGGRYFDGGLANIDALFRLLIGKAVGRDEKVNVVTAIPANGHEAVIPFQLDSVDVGKSLSINLTWDGSDVELHVTDPSGAVWTPARPGPVTFEYLPNLHIRSAVLKVPRAGAYSAVARGLDIPDTGERVSVQVSVDGSQGLELPLLKPAYDPGKSVLIAQTVPVGVRVPGFIRAQINDVNGSVFEVLLHDDGQGGDQQVADGVYSATVAAPLELGFYDLLISVDGFDAQGHAYEHRQLSTIQVGSSQDATAAIVPRLPADRHEIGAGSFGATTPGRLLLPPTSYSRPDPSSLRIWWFVMTSLFVSGAGLLGYSLWRRRPKRRVSRRSPNHKAASARVRSWTVGRGPSCDIIVDHPTVSRRHAEIIRKGDVYSIRWLKVAAVKNADVSHPPVANLKSRPTVQFGDIAVATSDLLKLCV